MQKFEISDKVREIASGDEGYIVESAGLDWDENRWHVQWSSGPDKGENCIFQKMVLNLFHPLNYQQKLPSNKLCKLCCK
jgi:hypothetical protein